MRRAVFLLSFTVVIAAILSVFASMSLTFTKGHIGWMGEWFAVLQRFSDPIPSIIGMHIPALRLFVFLIFAGLVFRRFFIITTEPKVDVPAAYSGAPHILLCLSSVSLVLGVIALTVVAFLPPGNLIVAIRILNPAMLLAPLAITWGELRSLKAANRNKRGRLG